MIQSAAICESFFTSYSNVFMRGALKPGESFLVHGGTSGIGTSSIQVPAVIRGFWLAGESVREQGVHNRGRPGEVRGVPEAGRGRGDRLHERRLFRCDSNRNQEEVGKRGNGMRGRGVNVILDYIGGDYAEKNIKLLAEEGRMVIIGFMKGPRVGCSDEERHR